MSGRAPAIVAIDRGTATTAVSLVARAAGRWRLLGSAAAPASVGPDVLLDRLRRRLAAADPSLARELGLSASGPDPGVLACRTTEPPVLGVLAASARVLGPLVAVASTAGWRVRPMAIADAGPLETTRLLADPSVAAILVGTSAPPGADERSLIPELVGRVAAATQRRPDVAVVLAGGLGEPGGPAESLVSTERSGATLLAAAGARSDPFGASLRPVLDALRGVEDDGRRALIRAAATLAEVLDRRTEVIEIGASAGVRAVSTPATASGGPSLSAIVPDARLVPFDVDDALVDAVAGWLAVPMDQLRLRDRLRELALAPWADLPGDGAVLRAGVARAALARLVGATPSFLDPSVPVPELLVVAGGVWQGIPPPVVGLAVVDVIRRPGAVALALDHARLLAPLGTIEDDDERRLLVGDLRDELLVPIGSVLMPAGLRAGQGAGHLTVHGSEVPAELDLVPGGLELVDLPPGERAIVEVRFRDTVNLGLDGRRFAVEMTGGLGGLLVDLRGVPLTLPDRPERRRDLLAAWQSALWAGLDA